MVGGASEGLSPSLERIAAGADDRRRDSLAARAVAPGRTGSAVRAGAARVDILRVIGSHRPSQCPSGRRQ